MVKALCYCVPLHKSSDSSTSSQDGDRVFPAVGTGTLAVLEATIGPDGQSQSSLRQCLV